MLLLRNAVLGILLLAAAFCDMKKRKIPNVLIVTGWLFSLFFHFLRSGLEGAFKSVVTVLIILATGFLLFLIRAVGAGDIKLCSVIGGIQGMVSCVHILTVSIFLAGIWSFAKLTKKRLFAKRFRYAWSYFTAGGAGRKLYYNKNRDGTDCTILLAPFLAAGYLLVLLENF